MKNLIVIFTLFLITINCVKNNPLESTPEENPTVKITSGPSGTIETNDFTFTWEGSKGVTGYYYSLDKSSPNIYTTGTEESFCEIENGSHTFYVKSVKGECYSTIAKRQFIIDKQTTPNSPNKPYCPIPESGSTIENTCFQGCWKYDGDRTGITFEIYIGESVTTLTKISTTSNLYYNFTGLIQGKTYYWKVVAVNSAGKTSGDLWSIKVKEDCGNDLPNKPYCPTPESGSTIENTCFQGCWKYDGDRTEITFEIYIGESITTLTKTSTTSNLYYDFTGLIQGKTYYWKVVAVNSVGKTSGDLWSVEVKEDCVEHPDKPENTCPENCSTIDLDYVDLCWYYPGDETGITFDIYFGNTANPGLYFSDYTKTEIRIPELTNGETYFWQIVAKNSAGETIGDTWHFLVEFPSMPETPTCCSPAYDEEITTSIALLEWDYPGDPTGIKYDVYFGECETPGIYGGNLTETNILVEGLESGHTYYWKVVAKNSAGETESETSRFKTKEDCSTETGFTDGFEDGWADWFRDGNATREGNELVTNYVRSGDYSLRLWGINGSFYSAHVYREIEIKDNLEINFSLRNGVETISCEGYTYRGGVGIREGKNYNNDNAQLITFESNGEILDHKQNCLCRYSIESWYDVKIILTKTCDKNYSVTYIINGNTKCSEEINLSCLDFSNVNVDLNAGAGTVWFDCIEVKTNN